MDCIAASGDSRRNLLVTVRSAQAQGRRGQSVHLPQPCGGGQGHGGGILGGQSGARGALAAAGYAPRARRTQPPGEHHQHQGGGSRSPSTATRWGPGTEHLLGSVQVSTKLSLFLREAFPLHQKRVARLERELIECRWELLQCRREHRQIYADNVRLQCDK